jgi:asparagine synthase (glutamine-hydrolysing)
MCGICGMVNLDGKALDVLALGRMTDALSHRGPDDKGTYIDKNVGLGHRRLKIIDLSDQAAQPMVNEDSSVVITYNGEIYNYIELRADLEKKGHIFKSSSDTEVVVHAYEEWGPSCLDRFNGMWAFCIWDKNKGIFFIARDRLGIKPFYYLYHGNVFIFASEVKAILETPQIRRKFNPQAILEYLYLGYTLNDKTWLKDINRLLPGHYLILDSRGLNRYKYWEPNLAVNYSSSEQATKDKLRSLLEDSLRLRLRSDVEIGAHLSGGIDSSSIVSLASRLYKGDICTFSGTFAESADYDESFFIRSMLNAYPRMNHRQIIIRPDNFLEVMEKIIWHLDEPVGGPGSYPQFFVSNLIRQANVKVVLGGQGGDELFGGYPYYYSGLIQSYFDLLRSTLDMQSFRYSRGVISLKAITSGLRRLISRALRVKRRRLSRTLKKEFLKSADFRCIEREAGFYKGSIEEMMCWDLKNYLPALLQIEDRLGMAFSVEARLPFLDHRLVEFALSIPFYFKINRINFKYILRESLKDSLPPAIYARRDKKGFPTPFKLWAQDWGIREKIRVTAQGPAETIFKNDRNISWEKLNVGLWLNLFRAGI